MMKQILDQRSTLDINGIQLRYKTDDLLAYKKCVLKNAYQLPGLFSDEDIIIDVGAHIGCFSLACLQRGAKEIWAFEPHPENIRMAEINLSPFQDKVFLSEIAIWRSDVKVDTLSFSAFQDLHSTQALLTMQGQSFYSSNSTVHSLGLDDVLRRFEKVALLKISACYAEYPILLTAKELSRVDRIICEVHTFPGKILHTPPHAAVEGYPHFDAAALTAALHKQGFNLAQYRTSVEVSLKAFDELEALFLVNNLIGGILTFEKRTAAHIPPSATYWFTGNAFLKDLCDQTEETQPFQNTVVRRVVRQSHRKQKVFIHPGKAGDIIYSLPTMHAMGGGKLLIKLFHEATCTVTLATYQKLKPLLLLQPYCQEVECCFGDVDDSEWDINLHSFHAIARDKTLHQHCPSLAELHLTAFGIDTAVLNEPWLHLPEEIPTGDYVVFSRSPRYHNPRFPWKRIWETYHEKALFLGTEEEHQLFCLEVGEVPFHHVEDFVEMAKLIKGSSLFVGNQSLPYAICEGMKHSPAILEVSPQCPNCLFFREGVTHGWDEEF